jgi:hypothetical protein
MTKIDSVVEKLAEFLHDEIHCDYNQFMWDKEVEWFKDSYRDDAELILEFLRTMEQCDG